MVIFSSLIAVAMIPASRAAEPAPEPQKLAFPSAWIGEWSGPSRVVRPGPDGQAAMSFTMELHIVDAAPDRWTWTIVYDGAAGRQERRYTLVAKDAASGQYQIDENNGIVLSATLIDGVLHSPFEVQGNTIIASYRPHRLGTADATIEVEMITFRAEQGALTGNKDGVPPVTTYTPSSVQRATLRPITPERGADRKSTP